MEIHPTAVVHKKARLPAQGTIGPLCVVEEDVEVGEGTRLESHVVLHNGVRLGRDCHLHAGVILGHLPMVRGERIERSYVTVGDRTVFFPHVTVERAHGEGETTRIGSDCFIMTEVHIGHNSVLGNHVTLASGVALGGHSVDEDYAFLGGGAVQHQHVRVGRLAMVGGNVRIIQDVPPYLLTADFDVAAKGLNLVGLRRYGMAAEKIAALKRAYMILYRSKLPLREALAKIEKEVATEEALYLVEFIRQSKRGICRE
ncbi:MAG: acyl-ACP--UDP-N-acetylglucosamine O-acyltransferase [Acidobacteria bacterium]|nr:acyl-ACP--UDP-N-acetylglucosamine O-acyltransferase [Acidobacteriota bacterium]